MTETRTCPLCGATLDVVRGAVGRDEPHRSLIQVSPRAYRGGLAILERKAAHPATFYACSRCEHVEEN